MWPVGRISSRCLNGERNSTTSLSLHDSFWLATRLPSRSMMPITRLLLCRSIPAITFFIGRLSVECCCSFILLTNDNSYREATASLNFRALNVYQFLVLITRLEPCCAVAGEDRSYLYDAAWNLNKRTNNGATSNLHGGHEEPVQCSSSRGQFLILATSPLRLSPPRPRES